MLLHLQINVLNFTFNFSDGTVCQMFIDSCAGQKWPNIKYFVQVLLAIYVWTNLQCLNSSADTKY